MSILKVENLKKYFGGVRAVEECSFKIEEKKITALVGPNGAGKTTVFNLISGFIEEDGGRIVFDGKELNKLPAWKRSRLGISRTFQLSRLFKNLSISDNLLLAMRDHDDNLWKMFIRGEKGDVEEKEKTKEKDKEKENPKRKRKREREKPSVKEIKKMKEDKPVNQPKCPLDSSKKNNKELQASSDIFLRVYISQFCSIFLTLLNNVRDNTKC